MADNLQRSIGRPEEYKFDRGGNPVEMGPFIGIVVNNIDNTRSGRLQVWIQQFGAVDTDGSPKLDDPTTWRTVRYISPFYGATQQSGASGVGTYPGNRNSYGMWFTPPELGTKVLCFFVGGDPSIGGYYLGCIPEDGINRMIPAIGAVSNFNPNNATQKQLLAGTTAAPVAEINDIDPKFTDDPRFFDKPKPVQSTVEGILFQQGLNKDPIRGPIKSSAQRESPSNCYGISTPGKPIYQGGYSDKTLKTALEKGQVKLQDIAVIGRQGGHTFVMDDGDIDGNDTLVRIRTAKGHQITMSDDGDAFYITHANGQTWIELGKAGTVDVYSTNSINLRTQGVLNFHADKGINMYSGGSIRIKSKMSTLINSADKLILSGDKFALMTSKQTLGFKSNGTLGLQGKFCSIKSDSMINLSSKLINLQGGQTVSIPSAPEIPDFNLDSTEFSATTGWTVKPGALQTIVSRAPTHEPYSGHGKSADVTTNLNPIAVTIPSATSNTGQIYAKISTLPVVDGVTADSVSAEPTAPMGVGPLSTSDVTALTAQTAQYHASRFPPYDDQGVLQVGWEINEETGEPYYKGTDLGSSLRGIGVYGQSPDALVASGLLKPSVINLINSGISPASVLESASSWTGQLGIGNITEYLNSKTLQNIVQVGLMAAAYAGLTDSGTITKNEDPKVAATFIQPATEYGVDSVVQWVDGFADSQTIANLEISARQGQYAIDFVDYYGEEINLVNVPIEGSNQRDVVDQTLADIIDNPKVPIPQYTDTPVEVTNTTQSIIQADGSIIKVNIPSTANEDGTFRLAPGNNQG